MTLSVTELNSQIKAYLEATFINTVVTGEASRVTYHSSGHLYFTLKDKNSAISCIMFRGNNQKLKFLVEDGMSVTIQGSISLYVPRGSYQLNCFSLEPSGEGSLSVAYEQLKRKLQEKGYFESRYKKQLPKFISHLGVVTSNSTAALQDVLQVAKKRWPLIKISLFHTSVQGKNAAKEISNALKQADKANLDAILLTRGGGSKEDLWCFNEEIVADTIFESNTPVISAIGHEIDTLISDLVADLRAPTPSSAIELILPDINEYRMYIDSYINRYNETYLNILQNKKVQIKNLETIFERNSIPSKIQMYKKQVASIKDNFDSMVQGLLNMKNYEFKNTKEVFNKEYLNYIKQKKNTLENLKLNFEFNIPSKKEKDGFAQILLDNKSISLKQLKKDDVISLVDTSISLKAKIIRVVKS